ncbi:MAG: undecaprenyl/decaprenyl-phosphate alpha-N-acetylglucosaminyl 1-phosphate transferase [Clostridia bacterium]|nr:undecaprenyl/decaprenyl-phosphate alpha-N-acetylglucosaminyl 1-phosphate transferase [Clostridia bacterium]
MFGGIASSVGFELASLTVNDLIYGFLAFLFSVLLAFALTPVIRVLAFKIGAVDVPKDARRMHKEPIPLIGGLGIFLSFSVSTLLFLSNLNIKILGFLAGMLLMVVIGIIDDVHEISAIKKLIGQIVAALIPVLTGTRIDSVVITGQTFNFPLWASILLTVIWIAGITNAINLIDGLDGLACGVSVIASFCLVLTAIICSSYGTVALLSLLLAGACLGFLPFNIHPAKMFMGDTGALMLGYALSTISVMGVFKFSALVSFVVPFLIVGLPASDTITSIVRRLLKGQSPFAADRGHLHHKLIDMGFSQRASVLILYAISALLGICAVMFTTNKVHIAVFILLIGAGVLILDYCVLRSSKGARLGSGVIANPEKYDETHKKESEPEEGSEESKNEE